MVGGFAQPLQHRVGIDLEHPGDSADAQAFRQRAHRPYQQVGCDAFAMERRAVGLLEIALARRAVELPPGATTRMAVGTEIAQSPPALIGTGGIGAELLRGVHLARASPAGDDRQRGGRWQGLWGLGRLLTGRTVWLVEEARKGLRGAGALARCLGSQRRCGAGGRAAIGPHDVEHKTQQHKADEQQLVDKRVWHHGIAPLTHVVKRGYCTRFSGYRISRMLEGHDRIKNPAAISPVWLEKPERIAALAMLTVVGLLGYTVIQRQVRLSLRDHDRHIPGNKGPTTTPTAAVVFALFAPVMLVQFALDNMTSLQPHGVQVHHLIVCEAVGIDPVWYQGAATGQNSLSRTTPP
jgi:hypothetical protein